MRRKLVINNLNGAGSPFWPLGCMEIRFTVNKWDCDIYRVFGSSVQVSIFQKRVFFHTKAILEEFRSPH